MFDLQKKLSASTRENLSKEYGEIPDISFDISLEKGRGDLTTSGALPIAKKLKKKPHDIAAAIAKIVEGIEGVESVEVAGPGFVNVTLKAAALIEALSIASAFTAIQKKRKDAPTVVDYSGPNIAKPLGIHHILSTVIGQVIVNLYKHCGYETVSVNHIGDWGTQFGKLAVAYKKWGKKPIEEHSVEDLLTLYVKFHEEVEKDSALEEEGRATFAKLEQGDNELRLFWKKTVDITLGALDHLYKRLQVKFDHFHGESFYEDKMEVILKEGKKKGVFVPGKEGAIIVDFPEATKLPPAIVLKADDSTIYLTRDLATARYRIDTWHPSELLYVVDIAQQLYFKQLFETLKMLGWELPHLEHVLFGRMRFADASMSTRKGNIVRLEDALDEAVSRADKLIAERGDKIQTDDPKDLAEMMGVGALVYGFLSQNRKMDIVFDWDKMLSFEGNSAPYLQYTHARARSVLRKAEIEKPKLSTVATLTASERYLVKLLLLFPSVLEEARAEHLPHRLANYLYDICQAFNSFYNSDEILTAPAESRAFRLGLTYLTAEVLRSGASLLTIRVPDRM